MSKHKAEAEFTKLRDLYPDDLPEYLFPFFNDLESGIMGIVCNLEQRNADLVAALEKIRFATEEGGLINYIANEALAKKTNQVKGEN